MGESFVIFQQSLSRSFFTNLKGGKILNPKIKFDVIFIDGLHLAEQVERDIENSLDFFLNKNYA